VNGVNRGTTIIGIDAATEGKKLGLARGRLEGDRVVVHEVVLGSEVGSVIDTTASWVTADTLIAVDAPLGWPLPLGHALREHRAGVVIEAEAHDLFRRVTDRFVHAILGKLPLEVGADRIARTAHAALRRLGELRRATRLDIPLAWAPGVRGVACIEVYPAATLRARGSTRRGARGRRRAPWGSGSGSWRPCGASLASRWTMRGSWGRMIGSMRCCACSRGRTSCGGGVSGRMNGSAGGRRSRGGSGSGIPGTAWGRRPERRR
jgi:predicted nuclease with RNAse H fold